MITETEKSNIQLQLAKVAYEASLTALTIVSIAAIIIVITFFVHVLYPLPVERVYPFIFLGLGFFFFGIGYFYINIATIARKSELMQKMFSNNIQAKQIRSVLKLKSTATICKM